MPRPVQVTMQLTAMNSTHVTFGYAYDEKWLTSMVISPEIWDMLGRPHSITTRMERI